MQAADDGSQGAQLLLNLKTPQVSAGTSSDAAVCLDVCSHSSSARCKTCRGELHFMRIT